MKVDSTEKEILMFDGKDILLSTFTYRRERPFEIEVSFHVSDGVKWVFSRDLLVEALEGEEAGEGDIRFINSGEHLCLELRDQMMVARLNCAAVAIRRFLQQTFKIVPLGEEVLDTDAAINALLGDL